MGNTAKVFNDAVSALNGGDLPRAEKLFRRVLRAEGSNVAALNLLVVVLMRLQRFSEAEPLIARATSINQNSEISFYNYGLISKWLNKPQQALEQFSKAIQLNSNAPESWNNRGVIFNDLKQHDLALADFDRSISLNPRYVEAYVNKGNSLTLLERYDDAFDAYDKALSIRPELIEASVQKAKILDLEFRRARTLAHDKRYDAAETAYRSFYGKYNGTRKISPALSNVASKKRAVFVGCARECAENIQGALANVANIASLFQTASYIFVENDSSDATRDLISRWCAQRASAKLVNLDGLAASYMARTMRIAAARNTYLDIVRSEFPEYDYLIVADLDDAGVTPFEAIEVLRAIEYCETNSACTAVFPVQQYYYDWFALRQKTLCPGDIFEEAFDRTSVERDAGSVARDVLAPKIFQIYDAIGMAKEPMEVDSAFGGVGIYKMPRVIKNRRSYLGHKPKALSAADRRRLGFPEDGDIGWQVCEHVEFHRGFTDNAEKLFLLPWFRNADTGPLSVEEIERRGGSFINEKLFLLPT
jgi:tetratricopeptide (TPR) repeat protein